MKNTFYMLLIAALAGLVACSPTSQQDQAPPLIEKQNISLTSDLMTPEVLWAFGRVSGPEVSPDGKTILYGVSYYSVEQNKGNRELYSVDVNGENYKQLTHSLKSEFNELWRPDGKKIGFLCSESGSIQLWEMNSDGSDRIQISNIDDGITGFKYSPDQTMILYTKEVYLENKFKDLYEGLPKASGRIMDDLLYRHWDSWVDSYSHVFYANYDGMKVWGDIDIMSGSLISRH